MTSKEVLRVFFVHHKLKGSDSDGDYVFDRKRVQKDFDPETPIEEAECAIYSEYGFPPDSKGGQTIRDFSVICSHKIVKPFVREKQKAEKIFECPLFDPATMASTYGKRQ